MPIRPAATLVISVDLAADSSVGKPLAERGLERAGLRVLELLGRHGIPATWAIPDPAAFPGVQRLTSATEGHEVAILADKSWVGAAAGRARFLRELARRVTAGRMAGMAISTLAMRDVSLDHVDLVLKQGLNAIRGRVLGDARVQPESVRDSSTQPRPLHYGLWELPITCRLYAQRGWMASIGAARKIRRQIDLGIATGGTVHLFVDHSSISKAFSANVRRLESVLRHVTLRRREGRLTVQTVAQTAAALMDRKTVQPARSILRPAA